MFLTRYRVFFEQSKPAYVYFRSEYDSGVNTFSPQGRLFQVEYAQGAIKLGTTALGIQTKEGVVLAVEKRLESKLLEPSSVKKILKLDQRRDSLSTRTPPDYYLVSPRDFVYVLFFCNSCVSKYDRQFSQISGVP
eukprot:905061-Amorphochlora_amoeboformis.AAC.1